MNFRIMEVTDPRNKSEYAKTILEKLPEWFGNEKSRNEYVEKVKELKFWAAMNKDNDCLGFFAVAIHYDRTGDIVVCGMDPACQRLGIGGRLYLSAEEYFKSHDCKYAIVKTLSEIVEYEPYERTRKFYRKMGFEQLITLTEMWDEENPCLLMIKSI